MFAVNVEAITALFVEMHDSRPHSFLGCLPYSEKQIYALNHRQHL